MYPLWYNAAEKVARLKREAEERRIAELVKQNLRADGKTVLSPVVGQVVTTPWGKKPNDNTYWQARGRHTGADYACNSGTPLRAVLSGVAHHRYDPVLGNIVLLYADDGNTYWYCHVSKRIANGTRVKANQVLAWAGMTGSGAAMGPHLHLEKRRGHTTSWSGVDINPIWY